MTTATHTLTDGLGFFIFEVTEDHLPDQVRQLLGSHHRDRQFTVEEGRKQ